MSVDVLFDVVLVVVSSKLMSNENHMWATDFGLLYADALASQECAEKVLVSFTN